MLCPRPHASHWLFTRKSLLDKNKYQGRKQKVITPQLMSPEAPTQFLEMRPSLAAKSARPSSSRRG